MARIAPFCLLLGLLTLTGCADTPESLAREQVGLLRDIVTTLEGIRDDASAKAAAPRIKQLGERGKSIHTRLTALNLTEAQKLSAIKLHEKDLREYMGRLFPALMKASRFAATNPELGEAILTINNQSATKQ